MSGPVSIVFSDIFMCKMEKDVVFLLNPFITNVMLMTHIYAERKMLMMNYSRI